MRIAEIKAAVIRTYDDIDRNHTLLVAAALSYYLVMAVFPGLVFLSAFVTYLPVPALFSHGLKFMSHFVPPDGMELVCRLLADVITPNRGVFLSFGLLGTLWAASSGFANAIEALNMAYDIEETRPFWKTRLLAVALTFLNGLLLFVALAVMIVGPRFGQWLTYRAHLSQVWVWVWPYIHWTLAIGFAVLAVEALYFFAPNVKQRFWATLAGALIAVAFWLGLSYLLGIYFRKFANFNKTYGALGAAVASMIWLYWTSFAMLVGAEFNAELAKSTEAGPIQQQPEPPAITKLDLSA